MGFDIGSHEFHGQGHHNIGGGNKPDNVPQKQDGPSKPQGNINKPSNQGQGTDAITPGSGTGKPEPKATPVSGNPLLSNPGSGTTQSLNTQINHTINEHQLPRGHELSENVSEETQERITQAINRFDEDADFDLEMKKFFNLLSKLYPYSLAILSSMLGADGKDLPSDFSEKVLKMLSDLGKSLGKHIDSLNIPKEMKAELKSFAEQLTNLNNFSGDPKHLKGEIDKQLQNIQSLSMRMTTEGNVKDLVKTIKGLLESSSTADMGGKVVSSESNSALFQRLEKMGLLSKSMLSKQGLGAEDLKLVLTQLQIGTKGLVLQTGSQSSIQTAQNLLQNASSLLGMLGMIKGLPQGDQKLALSTLLATQSIQSPNSAMGLIGPSVDKFSNNIGKFIAGLQKNSGLFSKEALMEQERQQLYSNAFKQVILSAALLGNMIAARGGRDASDDVVTFSLLKLSSAKDLGIIDQIPFSFLAFFPDLSADEDDYSDAIKMAKQSLLQLVRILLKLVFILVAIASAGTKLGQKGMDKMIEENAMFITGILDNLSFALKKVDESYAVNVNYHVALTQAAKDGLALKDYEHFWTSIIHMFAAKTELSSFLEDIEDARPLFKTIESLMEESELSLPVNIQF